MNRYEGLNNNELPELKKETCRECGKLFAPGSDESLTHIGTWERSYMCMPCQLTEDSNE